MKGGAYMQGGYYGYQPPMAGFTNPYQNRLEAMQYSQLNRYEVIHVNGESGARAFRMAPNSQCLLLDDTAPIVWLVTTDGAGYLTPTPYSITPFQAAPAPDFGSLEQRIKRLEDMLNDKSNTSTAPTDPKVAGAGQPASNG